MNKQIEEMAKAVREVMVACGKCGHCAEGDCFKPVDLRCVENEDILMVCYAIYEKGYRKSTDVAREIFAELERIGLVLPYEDYEELKKKYESEGAE